MAALFSQAVRPHERRQLKLFHVLPRPWGTHEAQHLISWPFLSPGKSQRTRLIDIYMDDTSICIEAVPEHGMAKICDSDVLPRGVGQIVEAPVSGCRISFLMSGSDKAGHDGSQGHALSLQHKAPGL